MPDRVLHIAVDGRELAGKPTGVGRYLGEVLRCWSTASGFPHRCTIVMPSAPAPALVDAHPTCEWHIDPAANAGTMWEQLRLPRALRAIGADVLFAAGYTAPLRCPVPFVVAVYDVSFFAHPEWFAAREGARRRWLTRSAARRAHRVITISEFSAQEIVRWIRVPRAHILIAAPGAPPVAAVDDAEREPLVLYVGSLFNRRHIPVLIEAFAAVPAALGARLVLVGDNRTSPRIDPRALAATCGVADRVDWREYVSDPELAALYRRARVFAFLSEYEGFGMTPLEAIASGVPPVVLDTAVAHEVYADAAVYTRLEAPAIARHLQTLLTDNAVHARLVTRGRERLGRFSWSATAATIRAALEDAARA